MNEKSPNNSEYQPLRSNLTIGRNAYRKNGERAVGVNGEAIYKGYEDGWDELQVFVDENGVEMSVVGKTVNNPETGENLFYHKRVPTAEVNRIQEMLSNTQREKVRRPMGKTALSLVKNPNFVSSGETGESLSAQRLSELAKPLQTNAAGEMSTSNGAGDGYSDYDKLFDPEDNTIEHNSVEDAASRKSSREKVTPENIEQAEILSDFVLDNNGELRDIVKKYQTAELVDIDQLRTNAELRSELLEYMIKRVDELPLKGDGVIANRQKTINYNYQVGKVSSHEAAALIALSMLDGSFDGESSRQDPVEYRGREVIRGQHRYAALQLLGVENSPYASNFIGLQRQ